MSLKDRTTYVRTAIRLDGCSNDICHEGHNLWDVRILEEVARSLLTWVPYTSMISPMHDHAALGKS
jgi:hypothetical protein